MSGRRLAILLVEDDVPFAERLGRFLEKEGHEVEHAASGEAGLALFESFAPDVVLLDLVLPGIDGMEVLERMREALEAQSSQAEPLVVVMTGHGTIATAVDAMRLGASDYVTKPVDLEALSVKLDQLAERIRMRADLAYLLDREREDGLERIIGSCDEMRAVYEKIREVARTDNTTVLVTGQSGTGKELVSRAIHTLSARRHKPFMQIDCTAIPLELLENELFGHERGAFTGAQKAKKGLLEIADRGTLFLDEIGDMPPELQSKLLRILQERRFRRVGGTRDLRFDVRVIAATNQDLERLVEEKRFRSDLLFRLKVFEIELPPLAERGDDILILAAAFIREFAKTFRKPLTGLDEAAKERLLAYPFPGNIRELRNVIEQAAILAKGDKITADLLSIRVDREAAPVGGSEASDHLPLRLETLGEEPLKAAERELIRQAMRKTGGNKKRAAGLLGISRFQLQRRLQKMADPASGE